MKKETKSRTEMIDGIMCQVEACYPGQGFDEAAIDIWHRVLAPYEIKETEKAFFSHIQQSRFLPTIAEIKGLLDENKKGHISIEARAQQEWRGVMSAVRQLGAERRPRFLDPVTAHLIKTQFPWSYLCGMLEKNENWEQKRWCEAYDLASSIHKDLLEIEVSDEIRGLLDTVAKSVAEPNDSPQGRIIRPKTYGPVDRESRIAELRAQAQKMLDDLPP